MVRLSVKSVSLMHKTDSDNMSFQNESEATNLERQPYDPQRDSHKEFKAFLERQNDQDHQIQHEEARRQQQEELRPSELVEKKPQLQPKLERIQEEPRVSHPRRPSNPYNEALTKTFESSEFEQACPDILPGMIFGANRTEPAGIEDPQYAELPQDRDGQQKRSSQMQEMAKASPEKKTGPRHDYMR